MATPHIERFGIAFGPDGRPWHQSHCQNPFAQDLGNGRFRVHFACRDAKNRSQGGWADIVLSESGFEVTKSFDQPSLRLGRPGAFDDAGAMPGCLVEFGGQLLLYYTGWTLARTVPFTFFVGLARSTDGGDSFEKMSESPVLGRNRHDPFLTGAPWVLSENGRLRMWYISGTEWVLDPDEKRPPVHYYTIKHATSDDGWNWETNDQLCLPYLEGEHAIARPVVRRQGDGYEMLYSARRLNETYRVYRATSADGLAWTREPSSLLETAVTGWDSEMVCYASWLDTTHGSFVLYNGNAYGKDGFGVARLANATT